MKNRKALWNVMLMLIPTLALNNGCAGSVGNAEGSSATMRTLPLIIKVNKAADESALRARLPDLATACEVELSYKRPMSGGAHIVQMRAPMPEAALHCLRGRPEVVYVQEDKLAHPTRGGAQ
jgi:hypothetical protein